MPHIARYSSESGFYHVVPKGIADQLIFEDDDDRRMYVNLLRKAKGETGILVHAYCLMSNHVHLIVEDQNGRLSDALKYVHERYAMHFAEKIGRTGGILRKPYWREPIDTDEHFLCAVRYAHANPAAACICAAAAYPWSSARDYLGREGGITDTDMVLDMLGGKEGFIAFSREAPTATAFEGSRLRGHLTDDEARWVAERVVAPLDLSAIGQLPVVQRRSAVQALSSHGFGQAAIARLTGLGRKQIRDALA